MPVPSRSEDYHASAHYQWLTHYCSLGGQLTLEIYVLKDEFSTKVEIYTEEGVTVYLNGVKLQKEKIGYYKNEVLITPKDRKITVQVDMDENTKLIERTYNIWQ